MTIFLTRHAHAGKRSAWTGDDRQRPLSDRGLAQSLEMARLLADAAPRRLVSSPYRRCVQTLEPLGAELGVEVIADEVFAEGSEVNAAVRAVLALDEHDGVACSHGDLIPPILRRLCELGMEVDGPLVDQKGSIWTIETDELGRPIRGTYQPPLV